MSNRRTTTTSPLNTATSTTNRAADLAQQQKNASKGFDAHAAVMRNNEKAAQTQAQDPDALSRIYQEAVDGDGEELEALRKNGLMPGAGTGKPIETEPSTDVELERAAPSQDDTPPEEPADDNKENKLSIASHNQVLGQKNAAQSMSGVDQRSLAERQETLVGLNVGLPDNYRGLSSAGTNAMHDSARSIESLYGSAGMWTRTPESTASSMEDQMSRSQS